MEKQEINGNGVDLSKVNNAVPIPPSAPPPPKPPQRRPLPPPPPPPVVEDDRRSLVSLASLASLSSLGDIGNVEDQVYQSNAIEDFDAFENFDDFEENTEQVNKFQIPPSLDSEVEMEQEVEFEQYTERVPQIFAEKKKATTKLRPKKNKQKKVSSFSEPLPVKNVHGVNENDLFNGKRLLKRIDIEKKKPLVRITKATVFDLHKGDGHKDRLPLNFALTSIERNTSSSTITSLDLSGLDQLTDIFFYVLMNKGLELNQVDLLICKGCTYLTDLGVKWAAACFEKLEKIDVRGCKLVTERSLEVLLGKPSITEILMQGTGVVTIPPERVERNDIDISVLACQLVSPPLPILQKYGKEYYEPSEANSTDNATKISLYAKEMKKTTDFKAVVWSEFIDFNFVSFLQGESHQPRSSFSIANIPFDSSGTAMKLNVFETSTFKTLLESFITEETLFILPYKVPESLDEKLAKSLARIVCTLLIKGSQKFKGYKESQNKVYKERHFQVQLLGIGTESDDSRQTHEAMQNFIIDCMKKYREDMMVVLTTLQFDDILTTLDFHDQRKFSLLASQAENLLASPFSRSFLASTNKADRETYLSELTQLLMTSSTVHHQHLHQLQALLSSPDSPDLFTTQDWDAVMSKDRHLSDSYKGAALSAAFKVVSLAGSIIYLENQHNKPVITNMQAVEQILRNIFWLWHQKRTKADGDRLPLNFCGEDVVRLSESDVLSSFDVSENGQDDMIKAVILMMEDSGTLLRVPCYRTKEEQSPWAYILFDHLPDEPHVELDDYWMPHIIPSLFFQVNWFYHFPAEYPDGLMALFFKFILHMPRSIVALFMFNLQKLPENMPPYSLVEVWTTVSTWGNPDQPVLAVCARAPVSNYLKPQENKEVVDATVDFCIWSTMQMFTSLLDHVLQRLNVFAEIKIPCKTCVPSQKLSEIMKAEKITWVTPKSAHAVLGLGQGCLLSCASNYAPGQMKRGDLIPPTGLTLPLPRHHQDQCDLQQKKTGTLYTQCFLCENCSAKGLDCARNGISSKSSLHCDCNKAIALCPKCGICPSCQHFLHEVHSELYPGLSSILPFFLKEKPDGKVVKKEEYENMGSILSFAKTTKLLCHQSMRPEMFNYWEFSITEKRSTTNIVIEFRKADKTLLVDYHLHKSLINVAKENGEMQNSRKVEYGIDAYDVVGFRVRYDDSCRCGPLQRIKPGPKIALDISINGHVVKTVSGVDRTPLTPRVYTSLSSCSLWISWKTLVNGSFRPAITPQKFEKRMLLEVYRKKKAQLMVVTRNYGSDSLQLAPAVPEGVALPQTALTSLSATLPVLHPVGWHVHYRCPLQVYDVNVQDWKEINGKQQVQNYLNSLEANGMEVAPYGCFSEIQTDGVIPHFQDQSSESIWDVLCFSPFQSSNRLKSAFCSDGMIKQLREMLSMNQAAVLTPCLEEDFWKGQRSTPGSFRVSDIWDPLNLVLTPVCTSEAKSSDATYNSPWHYQGHLVHSTLEVPAEIRSDSWLVMFIGHLLLALQPQVSVPARTEEIKKQGADKMSKLINRFFWHFSLNEMMNITPKNLIPRLQKIFFPAEDEKLLPVMLKLRNYLIEERKDCDIRETEDNHLYCPAHSIESLEETLDENGGVVEEVAPYLPMIERLTLEQVSTLPPSLTSQLHHLHHLEFGPHLHFLTEGLSQCKNLRMLILKNSSITQLPEDLANTSLTKLDLSACALRPLPEFITKMTSLESLIINDMLLLELPNNIHCLRNLQVLEANRNLLSDIPPKFEKLKRLRKLHLSGFEGGDMSCFDSWNKDLDFSEFMQRFQKELDNLGEGASQEALTFSSFPRFGLSQDVIDDDLIVEDEISASGIPAAIFSLKCLEELIMSRQALRYIPSQISYLKKLHKLDVSHCPLLISLPASLGSLPITDLSVGECPLMKTPPVEVRVKGSQATMAYLARLQSGSVTCKRTKLMLVGLGGAGKTSLVQALMKEKLTSKNGAEQPTEVTDGIDICVWNAQEANDNVTFSVWDFAGQTVYYNTHQFFLSNRAVYLLLWNVRLGHEHAGLHFWLGSISVHAPKAPVFVVGTHIDEVSRSELPMAEFKSKYPMIAGFHFVSSKSGKGIFDLKKQMMEVALNQPYMGELIPEVWLKFENAVVEERSRNSVIEYRKLEEMAAASGIFNDSELTQAVQFLHDLGSLQHFKSEFLKDRVVINPQWIVDVMACVVSVKDSSIKDGKFLHQDVGKVWWEYPEVLHQWLLRLTEEFDLTFPLSDQEANIVPCLLPDTMPQIDWPTGNTEKNLQENKMVYIFEYLPAGLFNRVQVRLYQYSDASVIWKRGSLLNKNDHKALVLQTKDNELEVKVYGPRPENVLFLVHEVIETLIAESFRGISFDYFVTCPDCLKQNVKDPARFSASMVRKASSRKAPFLQCNTNFHVISMTDLHANMPPDNNQDYDLHLSVALEGLASLRKNLATDVFVSYCENDMNPSSKRKKDVTPAKIKEDLVNDGFKCFFPSSTQSMQQLGSALRDARMFLIVMSDSYANDMKCVNMFNFAHFTMNKPMMLVQIGSSQAWKKSKLGLVLAQEVFVNMQKPDLYPVKFNELTSRLRQTDNGQGSKKKSHPTCFISYCWQNSNRAKEKGTRCPEEALGFGDPREIKDFLQRKGIECWMDIEQVGKKGLFEDIAEGLRHSKVVVACISDEYAASSNCLMEFRFAKVLGLPIVLAVVGTGTAWRNSEVGMLSLNYKMVNFQQPVESAFEDLQKYVAEALPSQAEHLESQKASTELDDQHTSNASFQELYELAQRKFLRQIAQYAESAGDIYPRLIVLDFTDGTKSDMSNEAGDSRPGTARLTRRESMTTNIPASVMPPQLNPVFKILCEHDEGWHPFEGSLDATGSEVIETLPEFSPYLSRIMSLLQQSSSAYLKLTSTDQGKAFLKWLKELPQATQLDFGDVYKSFRQKVMKMDSEGTMGQLSRCHLPNGKTIWLCPEHQKSTRLTVLDKDILVSQRHGDFAGDEAVSNMVLGPEGKNWQKEWLTFWTNLRETKVGETQGEQEAGYSDDDNISDDDMGSYDDTVKQTRAPLTNKTPARTELQIAKQEQQQPTTDNKTTNNINLEQNDKMVPKPSEEPNSNSLLDRRKKQPARRLKLSDSGISLTDMPSGYATSTIQPLPPLESRPSSTRLRRNSSRLKLLNSVQATAALTRAPSSAACAIL